MIYTWRRSSLKVAVRCLLSNPVKPVSRSSSTKPSLISDRSQFPCAVPKSQSSKTCVCLKSQHLSFPSGDPIRTRPESSACTSTTTCFGSLKNSWKTATNATKLKSWSKMGSPCSNLSLLKWRQRRRGHRSHKSASLTSAREVAWLTTWIWMWEIVTECSSQPASKKTHRSRRTSSDSCSLKA